MIKEKILLGYMAKLAGLVIQMVGSIVVARIAGPTVVGILAFSMAFVTLFQMFADMGIGIAHIKIVSEGENVSDCIATFGAIKIFCVIFYAAIVLFVFIIRLLCYPVPFETIDHQYVILLLLAMAIIEQLVMIPQTTFMARMEQAKQEFPRLVGIIFLQIIKVSVVMMGYQAIAIAACQLTAALLTGVIVYKMFKNYSIGRFRKSLAKRYIAIAAPSVFLIGTSYVCDNIDRLLLQYFHNAREVGFYSIAYSIASMIDIIAISAGSVLFPLYSRYFSQNNISAIVENIDKYEKAIYGFLMPVVILCIIYAKNVILYLFGETYIPSAFVAQVLFAGMLIRVTNVSYGNFLFGRGRFLLSGIIKFLECALRVLFIYLFSHPDIMNKGAYGTAVAFVLSTVFIGIVWRVYSKKEYDKISCSSQIKYILFGIAVMIMFSFFRSRLMQDGNLVNETLFIGLYLFVVYSFYFKMRWLKKNDLQYILPASYVKNLIFSCRNIFK